MYSPPSASSCFPPLSVRASCSSSFRFRFAVPRARGQGDDGRHGGMVYIARPTATGTPSVTLTKKNEQQTIRNIILHETATRFLLLLPLLPAHGLQSRRVLSATTGFGRRYGCTAGRRTVTPAGCWAAPVNARWLREAFWTLRNSFEHGCPHPHHTFFYSRPDCFGSFLFTLFPVFGWWRTTDLSSRSWSLPSLTFLSPPIAPHSCVAP